MFLGKVRRKNGKETQEKGEKGEKEGENRGQTDNDKKFSYLFPKYHKNFNIFHQYTLKNCPAF